MAILGFSDALSLVQSIVLIGALGVTLYFSSRQARSQKVELETRVLVDIDKMHQSLSATLQEDPSLLKVINNELPGESRKERHFAYEILLMCAHIYHMRERKILSENEWNGELKWMKNAFRRGLIRKTWKDDRMEEWFDPAFSDFVNSELVPPPNPSL
jgi:hypothetical protein